MKNKYLILSLFLFLSGFIVSAQDAVSSNAEAEESAILVCQILANVKVFFELIVGGLMILWVFVFMLCVVIAIIAYMTLIYPNKEDKKQHAKGKKIVKISLLIGVIPPIGFVLLIILIELVALIVTANCYQW